MLAFALLLASSAAAMEIGLNMTGSGTAQSQLSAASTSGPETTPEVIVTLSAVSSSASPTSSSVSPTITNGPIYTNFCDSYQGRNCDRLPEQPYWSGISPGDDPYGFTPTAQQNPFSLFLSFTESGQPSSVLETESLCSIAWYTNYTSWLATAPLTYSSFSGGVSGLVPASTVTSTLDAFTATDVSYGSTTGTATVVVTYTESFSGAAATTDVETETSYLEDDSTYITTQTATTETLIYTAYSAYYYPSYSWSAQPPCCSACTIYAGEIEVMYFPPATASGNISSTQPSTVVNSVGFTFTSPSIYMALQTLAASDLCGPVGSSITDATTLSFAPSQLSTVPAYSSDGSIYTFYPYWSPTAYEPATFGTAPCTDETTVTAVDSLTATVTYNPCYPYISIPPQVQTADPLWSTCTSQWQFLLYDPPYVISAAQGLGAFSSSSRTTSIELTTSPALETTSSVASTGPTPPAPTVAPTTTATLDPTTATSAPVQPASTQSSAPVQPTPSNLPGTSSSPVAVDPGTGSSTSPVAVDPGTGTSSPAAVNPGTGASSSPVAVNPGTGESTSPGAIEASSSPDGVGVSPNTSPAVVTIGSSTITANSGSGFVIGSTTLTPGGKVTVGETTVSLASNGQTIAIGSSTQALVTAPSPTYVIGSQTLSAGGSPITVSGTTYSLESGGSSVVIDGSTTEALSAFLGSTTTTGLASIIATIGGFGTSTTGSLTPSTGVAGNGTVFTASAMRGEASNVWVWGSMLGACMVVVGLL